MNSANQTIQKELKISPNIHGEFCSAQEGDDLSQSVSMSTQGRIVQTITVKRKGNEVNKCHKFEMFTTEFNGTTSKEITMNNQTKEIQLAVAEAAGKIIKLLPKDDEGKAVGTSDPEVLANVGDIVEQAVDKAGGDFHALFVVAAGLSAALPFGARRLRLLWHANRRDKSIGEAAVGILELLAGDPAADFVEIGKLVDRVLGLCGGSHFESDVLSILGKMLQVSPRKLRQYKDGYLVFKLGGADLAKLVPNVCPFSALSLFSQILKADLMPWRKKDLIIKTVETIARKGLQWEKAAVAEPLALILAEDAIKATFLPIAPAWHAPTANPGKAEGTKAETHEAA